MSPQKYRLKPAERLLIIGVTLIAFGLRLWRIDIVPPGWRDDELINSLVISQKVLDGDWAVYYPDASGHEALYHALNAVMLELFGAGTFGIRWLSVILGTMTIPVTWLVGRFLFGSTVGLVAAAGLTLSFWSLMYSRIGLRHILVPLLTAATVYFFWVGVTNPASKAGRQGASRSFLWAAIFMGLGFYTYFASRGLPLIFLAFCVYLWLAERTLFIQRWRGFALMFGIAALMSLPLLITLSQQPENEARVAELAVPLVEASEGNLQPLWDHIRITLNMYGSDGDGEWLYNIPHRPVFGPVGAIFFWMGVATAALIFLVMAIRRIRPEIRFPVFPTEQVAPLHAPAAFLLMWWLAAIAPAFISVPPASLGHTIMAQPAVFILAALPTGVIARWSHRMSLRFQSYPRMIPLLIALSLLGSIALRDLPDYYREWPRRGMVRFLYRADIRELADYLNRHPELRDFAVSGLLAGPWDRVALSMDLDTTRSEARPRWYDPRRAIMLQPALSFTGSPKVSAAYADFYAPGALGASVGEYRLTSVKQFRLSEDQVCFENGLCSISATYDETHGRLELEWELMRPLDLPNGRLISNPPPPGVYAGPRLLVFGQLQDSEGNFLVGDDGLWVDPASLQAGDRFLQQHWLPVPDGKKAAMAVFGLYDPMTGRRLLTEDGQDQLRIAVGE